MSEIYNIPEYQEEDFDIVFEALSVYRRPEIQGYTLSEAAVLWREVFKSFTQERGYTEADFAQLQMRATYILDGIGAMERELRKLD
jgi:hypothetical protein